MDFIAAATTTSTLLTLRGGQRILLSPATTDDTASVADLLLRLSSQTIRLRYLSTRSFTMETAWAEAERMTQGRATLVATPVQRAFARQSPWPNWSPTSSIP